MKKPAKKASVAAKVEKPVVAKSAKSALAKAAVAKAAVAAVATKPAAPGKKKPAVAAEPPVTFISAQIDIGFGNHLTIRGEGPGLGWDDGVVMDCVGPNLWTIAIRKATKPVVFKVLVNDLNWNVGGDYLAEPGKSVTIYPAF